MKTEQRTIRIGWIPFLVLGSVFLGIYFASKNCPAPTAVLIQTHYMTTDEEKCKKEGGVLKLDWSSYGINEYNQNPIPHCIVEAKELPL